MGSASSRGRASGWPIGQPPRPVALARGEHARRIIVALAAARRAKIGPEGGDRRRGRLAVDGMQRIARRIPALAAGLPSRTAVIM